MSSSYLHFKVESVPQFLPNSYPRLANKQDHLDALDEVDVADKLQLEILANACQTPTRIEICSATQGTGKNIDPIIRIGFQYYFHAKKIITKSSNSGICFS